MTDRWSGFVVAVPTTTTLDSSGYAHLIYDEWVVRHNRGIPRMFITDRAPIATAKFNDCWCTLMGIKQTMTTVARSSKANAMAEITIQMLFSPLCLLCFALFALAAHTGALALPSVGKRAAD